MGVDRTACDRSHRRRLSARGTLRTAPSLREAGWPGAPCTVCSGQGRPRRRLRTGPFGLRRSKQQGDLRCWHSYRAGSQDRCPGGQSQPPQPGLPNKGHWRERWGQARPPADDAHHTGLSVCSGTWVGSGDCSPDACALLSRTRVSVWERKAFRVGSCPPRCLLGPEPHNVTPLGSRGHED